MTYRSISIVFCFSLFSAAQLPGASGTTYVTIPTSDSIQTNLVSTFPTGIFKADNSFKTPFKIPAKPDKCGYTDKGACNFYDGFGTSGDGQSITIDVSIANPALVYTLMNAYSPPPGAQIATIEFIGSSGTTETFALVAGDDIRDFYQGQYANTLNNGVANVHAENAFTCDDPSTCLGSAGTGDVNTGLAGTYNLDEQQYALEAAFASQDLVKIVITDTNNGSVPILLGITVASATKNPPTITSFSPTKGDVDATVTITGKNLLGATTVDFNGVPATPTVETDLTISATVPPGATSGPIKVTTPYGTATSKKDFTVK